MYTSEHTNTDEDMEKQVVALDEELTSLKLTVAELEKERWEIKGRVYKDFIISDFFSISFGKNIPPVLGLVLSCPVCMTWPICT